MERPSVHPRAVTALSRCIAARRSPTTMQTTRSPLLEVDEVAFALHFQRVLRQHFRLRALAGFDLARSGVLSGLHQPCTVGFRELWIQHDRLLVAVEWYNHTLALTERHHI